MRQNASASGASSSGSSYNHSSGATGVYREIRNTIQQRKFTEAERMLLAVPQSDRTAEWHYLASVLLMHRNRQNDAMRELEIACGMDPSNLEYQKAKEMFNNSARGYGSSYYGSAGAPMRSNSDEACNCCANLLCMDYIYQKHNL